MIRYALKCKEGHQFESWFASVEAFDRLSGGNMVQCPDCGSAEVAKSLMAPGVRPGRGGAAAPGETDTAPAPEDERAARLQALRKNVEANSEYVGLQFAAEARRMHEGDTPKRSIYGEAKATDAIKLVEDGVPVAPLPFRPTRKSN